MSLSRIVACALSMVVAVSGLALLGRNADVLAVPGDELWKQRFAGEEQTWQSAQAMAVSPTSGRVYVTGHSSDDFLTVAYTAEGELLWIRTYTGKTGQEDYSRDIAVSSSGKKIFVTGESYNGERSADFATIAYRSDGTELWRRLFEGPVDGPSNDFPRAITTSPTQRRVYVTGTSASRPGYWGDVVTVAYAFDGRRLWTRRYNGPASRSDEANALMVSPNGGRVFVTGVSQSQGNAYDFATVSYRSDGTKLWVRRYDGPQKPGGDDRVNGIAFSAARHQVVVAGSSSGRGTGRDIAIVAYRADGTRAWLRRYDSRSHGRDSFAGIVVQPQGEILVTGSTGRRWERDFVTLSYRKDGSRRWVRTYDGPSGFADFSSAIAAEPNGAGVFVTGLSRDANDGGDYATIFYAAGGTERWVMRYDGLHLPPPNRDAPYDMAVSPDGSRVFVTGTSDGPDHSTDCATVGYSND